MKTLLLGLIAGLSLGLFATATTTTTALADDTHHHGTKAHDTHHHGTDAHDTEKQGGAALMITDAWSRVTTPGAKVGGGYLTLHNSGMHDDRLLSVSAPHAGKTEIHSMIMKDDVMIMRPVDQALTIEAGAVLQLAPGGLHLMFMQLEQPHVEGEALEATLTFEHAGAIKVVFDVLSMRDSLERMQQGAGGHGHDEGHDHGHGHSHNDSHSE